MISMADVLPQGKMALRKVAAVKPPASKPKEKKIIKDKGGLTKSKKTAKNVALLPSNYMSLLQLASAADPASNVPPSAVLVATSAVTTPVDCIQTPTTTEAAAMDLIKCESSESLQLDFGEGNETSTNEIEHDTTSQGYSELELPAPLDAPETPYDEFHNSTEMGMDSGEVMQQSEGHFIPRHGPLMTPGHHLVGHPLAQQSQSMIHPTSSPTPNNRHKREKPATHTPRPPNSFIIYRKEKHAELMSQSSGTATLNNNVISKIVGTMWKQEPPEVKAMYAAKAQEEKRVHMLKHPDYKYRPKKSPPKQGGRTNLVTMIPVSSAAPRYVKVGGPIQQHPQQHHQQALHPVGGSMSAAPPAISSRNSSTVIGGMGMSMPSMDDFQYCPPNMMPQEFLTMQQGMYASHGGYTVSSSFEQQQQWGDNNHEMNSGFAMPLYWTSSQLQQSPQQTGSTTQPKFQQFESNNNSSY
ncbi:UNVERIFIED_CONTAM: hypothetical protein HDU68_008704 [Siphonaria sp. JEL0065]|nr:hypothetical protein HDU68_008704 [Siphonaria sp. JEL0065]